MAVVAILGAGAMGSALATPALTAGHEVRLWATWLDDEVLAALRAGQPHPRTGVPVDRAVSLHAAAELPAALDGADVVVLAVASEGVPAVLERAREDLGEGVPVAVCSKGFGRDGRGRVRLLPPIITGALAGAPRPAGPLIAVGGPCKANEVATGRATAAVYAADDLAVAEQVASRLATGGYRIATSNDVTGVETAAAMKNVYAIALGVVDGWAEARREAWHDLRSAVFARASVEMQRLAGALGGHAETASGLAGVGDLEVTGLSGRNQAYGARIGRGQPAEAALAAMTAAGQTVEGAIGAGLARELIAEEAVAGLGLAEAVSDVVGGGDDPLARIADAALPPRRDPA